MKTHSRYNYITFCNLIWPKITPVLFESMVNDFLIRVKLNREVVVNLLGSGELIKLLDVQIPKILRNNTARIDANKIAVWHVFVIGQWSVSALTHAKKTSMGRISYDPAWEEPDHAANCNSRETWDGTGFDDGYIDPYGYDYDPRFEYNGINKLPKL